MHTRVLRKIVNVLRGNVSEAAHWLRLHKTKVSQGFDQVLPAVYLDKWRWPACIDYPRNPTLAKQTLSVLCFRGMQKADLPYR